MAIRKQGLTFYIRHRTSGTQIMPDLDRPTNVDEAASET